MRNVVGAQGHAAAATEPARSALPVATAILLLAAWWLSLIVLWKTPLVSLTPAKLLIVGALPLLPLGRVWTLGVRGDRWPLGLVAALVGWYVVVALIRGSSYDLKVAGSYVIYFGGPFALAYAAARARPQAAALALLAAALVGLGITFLGVVLERFTYPAPGVPDPFEPIWSFVRPQSGMSDLGASPPALHTPSGDPSIPRVSSWFPQANYLAYFIVLVAGAAATGLLAALRMGRRSLAVGMVLALTACSVTAVWTYSRAGLVGLIAIVCAVVGLDVLRDRARWRSMPALAVRGAPLVLVAVVLGGTLLADTVGLRRFVPLVSDAGPPPSEVPRSDVPASIEKSAAQAAAIRLAMQGAAVALVTATPFDFVLGPGQEAFNEAVHDPASRLFVPNATGVIDPNSLWLSAAISGGIVAGGILVVLLALSWVRLMRSLDRLRAGPRFWLVGWLAAWIPVWGLLQLAGTFPFNPSEATILGTMLGASIAQAGTHASGQVTESAG